MSSETFKCTKCQVTVRKMDNFYICPNCMEDYATAMQMNQIQEMYRRFNQDTDKVVAEVQRLVDADKERLRLMLIHEEHFRAALDLIFKTHKDVLSDPRSAEGAKGEALDDDYKAV